MEKAAWSNAVIRKAEAGLSGEAVRKDPKYPLVYYVEGSTPGKEYRVQTDGRLWITCTCPNGQQHNPPNCWHTAAVMMVIRDEIDVKVKEEQPSAT